MFQIEPPGCTAVDVDAFSDEFLSLSTLLL
jgi:hypothetical protein